MKKPFLSVSLLIFLISFSYAQTPTWTDVDGNFGTDNRGAFNVSIPTQNAIWVSLCDGGNSSNYISEFCRSVDGGSTWTRGEVDPAASNLTIANICAINADTAWAAMFKQPSGGSGGGVYRTDNGGASWTKQSSASFSSSGSWPDFVYFWNKDTGVVVGDPQSSGTFAGKYEVYNTIDGGNTWVANTSFSTIGTEYPSFGFYCVADGYIFFHTVAASTNKVYVSKDFGFTWQLAGNSLFGGSSTGGWLCFKDSLNGLALENISTPANARLASTSDGGATWSLVGGTGKPANLHKYRIAYVPGTTGTYVSFGAQTNDYGSSFSTDNGVTWTSIDALQHSCGEFTDMNHGWSGGFKSSTAGGMFKWNFSSTAIENVNANSFEVCIFPNPASDAVQIKFLDKPEGLTHLILFDTQGKSLFSESIDSPESYTITRENIGSGVYFLQVVSAGINNTYRLILQ